jgi:hypothetical protein
MYLQVVLNNTFPVILRELHARNKSTQNKFEHILNFLYVVPHSVQNRVST